MEFTSCVAVVAMACLAALFFLSKHAPFRFSKLRLPPGPKPWPIIGNLNLIGPLPHQSLYKLSQKYGVLVQLKFGSFPVVVASSPEMARQFLKTHDHIFACRPQTAAGKYTTYNFTNISWAPYGSYLRQGRKMYLSELFSSKRLESYEFIRVEERRAFLSRLCALSGKPIWVKEHVSRLNLSIISRMVMGKTYFTESELETNSIVTLKEFQEILDELFLLNGVLNIGDWIPWLDFLDLQGYVQRMKILKKKLDRFHDHVFGEHKAAKREGLKDFVPKNMVDLLLQLADDPNIDVKLTYDNLKALTQDLVAGGTDTSATTVEWALSELLKQPNLIKKATEELDRVIGKDRWVEEKDIPLLNHSHLIQRPHLKSLHLSIARHPFQLS